MIQVSKGRRSRSPLRPLSLRMMSGAHFKRLPSDWVVVAVLVISQTLVLRRLKARSCVSLGWSVAEPRAVIIQRLRPIRAACHCHNSQPDEYCSSNSLPFLSRTGVTRIENSHVRDALPRRKHILAPYPNEAISNWAINLPICWPSTKLNI